MSALLLPEKCVLTRVAYAFWLLISLVKSAKKQKKKEDARAGEDKSAFAAIQQRQNKRMQWSAASEFHMVSLSALRRAH